MMRPLYFIGIDGSTNTLGVCYCEYYDGHLVVLDHRLIDVTSEEDAYEIFIEKFGRVHQRLYRIEQELEEFCLDKHIDTVFYESHFINPRRPTSVIPLAKSQHMIEDFFMVRGIGVYTVTPQQMKRLVGTKVKGADKDDVRRAIESLVDQGKLHLAQGISLMNCSEHEIDAIGIVYAKLVEDGVLVR